MAELSERNAVTNSALVEIAVAIALDLKAARALIARQQEALQLITPEGGDWWCPTCQQHLSSSRVTNAECCDTCGTYLAGVSDPEWVAKARAAIAAADQFLRGKQ